MRLLYTLLAIFWYLFKAPLCVILILIFGGSHTVSLKNKWMKRLCCISRITLLSGHMDLKVAIKGVKFSWDWQNFDPCVVTVVEQKSIY